jgi:hypothetical protein
MIYSANKVNVNIKIFVTQKNKYTDFIFVILIHKMVMTTNEYGGGGHLFLL